MCVCYYRKKCQYLPSTWAPIGALQTFKYFSFKAKFLSLAVWAYQHQYKHAGDAAAMLDIDVLTIVNNFFVEQSKNSICCTLWKVGMVVISCRKGRD